MKLSALFISISLFASFLIYGCGEESSKGNNDAVISDSTSPIVSSTIPASSATGVAANSAVTATFSEDMDTGTFTTSTFILLAEGNTTPIAGAVICSGATAKFTPTENLSYNTVYTATIMGVVRDSGGNDMGAKYTWSFTTGGAPDTTPPTVSSTSPSGGAADVPVNAAVIASFSEALDPTTVSAASFIINSGSYTIAGNVSYSGLNVRFDPVSLLSGTAYTATITTGVKDASGNPLAENYVWSFTTTP